MTERILCFDKPLRIYALSFTGLCRLILGCQCIDGFFRRRKGRIAVGCVILTIHRVIAECFQLSLLTVSRRIHQRCLRSLNVCFQAVRLFLYVAHQVVPLLHCVGIFVLRSNLVVHIHHQALSIDRQDSGKPKIPSPVAFDKSPAMEINQQRQLLLF